MASWRANSAEHGAVPVEMRFIDMFMAALGALLFMAMLFVYVIAQLHPRDEAPPTQPSNQPQALSIVTKSLPSARARESYVLAVAYRGGGGTVSWSLDGNLPPGLAFDPLTGTFSGTPVAPGTSRFIVIAASRVGGETKTASQDLELVVEPPKPKSRTMEAWVTGIMLLMLTILLLVAQGVRVTIKSSVAELQSAHDAGLPYHTRQTGEGKLERVELPVGLYTEEAQYRTVKAVGKILFVIVVILSVWFVYRLVAS